MNEPNSLHELHQEDAEEERKRIAKFDRLAYGSMNATHFGIRCAAHDIERLGISLQLKADEILVITHAIWSAVRSSGNLHQLAVRQTIESLEETMLICQERIDQDLIDASDSLEAREGT